ncbi:MAG TPA: ATP-binding protein [Gemmatimonadales bacterium]
MPSSVTVVLPWVAAAAASVCALWLSRARRRDLVALRAEEEARSQSEARLRTLVERAAYGIYAATADGRFVEANLALARMLGHDTVEELLRRELGDLYADPADRERLLEQVASGTLPDWVEVEWRRGDGTPITVRLSARTEHDQHGRLLHCEGIVEDVTARRRQEEAQRRSERLAALGRLLAGTAHELNNPLAAVSGFSQLLLRGELPADVRQALETMDREANRAAAVVKDLLSFSRGPERRVGTDPGECDLNMVARYIVRARRYSVETRGVRIELALADGPLPVRADRSEVEQVLLNLVTNAEQALDAMADDTGVARGSGDAAPRIVLRSARGDGVAVLEVRDNGPGIAPEALPFVWDPFWTTKREGEGTGLGLSIVHEMVARMGGSVDVESAPGEGACFRVTLPLAPPRSAEGDGHEDSAGRPLDVLIADGDGTTADFLTRLLTRRGHAAVAAHDAPHALALATQGFDVAVIAAPIATSLEEGDARTMIERLRALPGADAARIVLVTDAPGSDAPDVGEHPAALADTVLGKPLDIEQLRRSIEAE